jgi:hypothetical protein
VHPAPGANIAEPARDTTIALARYQGLLRIVRVHAANRDWRFLFDTGGGSTMISPDVAAAIGCTPRGSITGHRMNGDAVVTPSCSASPLTIGGWTAPAQTLGVFNLMSLLPGDWPRLDGVISLRSFAGRRITLDLASNSLTVHSPRDYGNAGGGTPFIGRIATGPSGGELLAFAAVPVGTDTLWLEIDSGNLDAVLLSPHAARLLGLEDSVGTEHPEISLPLPEGAALRTRARVRGLILDGALNAEWLERGRLTLDLAVSRFWWQSRN